MDKINKILNNTDNFLAQNPHYYLIFFFLIGLFLLLGSIYNSDFLFGNPNRGDFSLNKLDGWVNFFGRNTARVILGTISFTLTIISLAGFLVAISK